MAKLLHPSHKAGNCQNFLRILKRKILLIFGVTFLGFSSTALFVQNMSPLYTAKAQLIFDDVEMPFIHRGQALLGSASLAQKVITKLKLMNDPDFNLKVNKVQKGSKFKAINYYSTKLSSLSNDIIEQEMESAISRFRGNFSSKINSNSFVMDLEYVGHNPRKAAMILNEIIKIYLKNITPEVSKHEHIYEREILNNLKNNSVKAQINLDKFIAHIDDFKPEARSEPPNETYVEAQIKYERAKSKFESFVGNNKSSLNLASPVMDKLRIKYYGLKQKLKELSQGFGSKHPDIISLKRQIIDVGRDIIREKNIIIMQLKSNRDQALVELELLTPPKKDNNANNYNIFVSKKLKFMQNQAEQSRSIFDNYKTVYERSLKQNKVIKFPVEILSQVSVSDVPISPNKLKILSIGSLAALLFGIFIAIFSEKMRNSFLSARQLEKHLNLPCYALIPHAKQDKDRSLSSYVLDNPLSDTAEAVRALKLIIRLCADDENRENKVIAITSSLPNEGKTTLSSWLAQLAAKSGEKVILIDSDLRRPSVHKLFDKKNTLSLAEYFSGSNKLDEVIDTSLSSGLHIIYGRSVPNSALDIVSSDKMEQLVSSLRKTYDLIIIDTPASMAVSDARAIAKISDQLLYAVLWNKTSRKIVHNGISQFTQFEKAHVATVLTNIDLKKHVQMGYGEAVSYYGSYK